MISSHNLTRTPGKPCKHKTSINSDPHPTAINSTEKISDLRNSWIRYQVLRPNETKQSQGLAPPSLCMSDTVYGLEPTTRKKKMPWKQKPWLRPFFWRRPHHRSSTCPAPVHRKECWPGLCRTLHLKTNKLANLLRIPIWGTSKEIENATEQKRDVKPRWGPRAC